MRSKEAKQARVRRVRDWWIFGTGTDRWPRRPSQEKALHWGKSTEWKEMKVGDTQGGSKQKMDSDRRQEDRCYKQGGGAQNEIIRGRYPTDHKKLKPWKYTMKDMKQQRQREQERKSLPRATKPKHWPEKSSTHAEPFCF